MNWKFDRIQTNWLWFTLGSTALLAAAAVILSAHIRQFPYLENESRDNGPRPDGFTHLRFHNKSTSTSALVQSIALRISDPVQLQAIERYHPKLGNVNTEAIAEKNEMKLVRWKWDGDDFLFYACPNLQIAPDNQVEVMTCIIDPKFAISDLHGRLEIALKEGAADSIDNVWIRSRRE